jgi:Tfp pilus assembly protein PilO
VSDRLHGTALARRALVEHRRIVITLVVGLLINVLVYALVVYPLSQAVANVEQRDQAAEQALAAARKEFDAAKGTLTGKDRAATELATFYKDVLPSDLTGARRLTHLRLAQLARETNLKYERTSTEPVEERNSTLTRLKIAMALTGSYSNMRTFIYQLETAPEFVVIDDIQLSEGNKEGSSLMLGLELSTYFQDGKQ